MKLESLKDSKFKALSPEQMSSLLGGDIVSPSNYKVLVITTIYDARGNAIGQEAERCPERNTFTDDGRYLCQEVCVDGVWS